MLITEQENNLQGFQFVFLICWIVPHLSPLSPLSPKHKNISIDTTLPFSLAAMNSDESINTDDVPTL